MAGYGVIEVELPHAFIRRHKPRRVVQVGWGVVLQQFCGLSEWWIISPGLSASSRIHRRFC
jgi:hypothetical protein